MTTDAAAWAEANLTAADGERFRLEPFQRHVVDAVRDDKPMRLLTPDEVRLSERRAVKQALRDLDTLAARLRERGPS